MAGVRGGKRDKEDAGEDNRNLLLKGFVTQVKFLSSNLDAFVKMCTY